MLPMQVRNPYDNAKAESFMKTLKVEAVYLMAYSRTSQPIFRVSSMLSTTHAGYTPRRLTAARENPLSSFANGIATDRDSVRAALVHPWSNGQTEGQITKLKLVKRQMYGRAKLDLLTARLLGTA